MISQSDKNRFNDFIGTQLPSSVLGDTIEWFNDNLEPEDVFDEKKLKEWAESNGYEKQ